MADRIVWETVPIDHATILGAEEFPLTTTVIERFLVWDDSPQYPKRFQIMMDFSGTIERQHWLDAIRVAIVRHPLLLAQIINDDRTWNLPSQPFVQLAWQTIQSDSGERIDVNRLAQQVCESQQLEPTSAVANLRIFVAQAVEQVAIVLDVFHPASDGLGARAFVEDMTAAYDWLCSDKAFELRWRKIDASRMQHRGDTLPTKNDPTSRKTTLWEKVTHGFDFHFRGPAALVRKRRVKAITAERSSPIKLIHRSEVLDLNRLQKLKQKLLHEKVDLNALALTALLCTCDDFKLDAGSNRHRLRISVPIDMRVRHDVRAGAMNKIGFAFVIADRQACHDSDDLLGKVQMQVDAIRQLNLGNDFIYLFRSVRNFGWAVRRILQLPICFATAVLTNLGDVTARQRQIRAASGQSTIGSLQLQSIIGWPPLRPNTQFGVGLCKFDHCLSIAMIFDGSVLTTQQIDALSKNFIGRLIDE